MKGKNKVFGRKEKEAKEEVKYYRCSSILAGVDKTYDGVYVGPNKEKLDVYIVSSNGLFNELVTGLPAANRCYLRDKEDCLIASKKFSVCTEKPMYGSWEWPQYLVSKSEVAEFLLKLERENLVKEYKDAIYEINNAQCKAAMEQLLKILKEEEEKQFYDDHADDIISGFTRKYKR
ncbi:MAG: hypothetical protein IJ565_00095 [Bacilli bacterium]|nr:hypothetical protein [Bacilli bacterium]